MRRPPQSGFYLGEKEWEKIRDVCSMSRSKQRGLGYSAFFWNQHALAVHVQAGARGRMRVARAFTVGELPGLRGTQPPKLKSFVAVAR